MPPLQCAHPGEANGQPLRNSTRRPLAQVRLGLADPRHRIRPMNRLDDLLAGALERPPEHEPNVRLIIDDQHSRHARFIPRRGASQPLVGQAQ
jgi:hypothetical protein